LTFEHPLFIQLLLVVKWLLSQLLLLLPQLLLVVEWLLPQLPSCNM
jgi:hypothetical protein